MNKTIIVKTVHIPKSKRLTYFIIKLVRIFIRYAKIENVAFLVHTLSSNSKVGTYQNTANARTSTVVHRA